MKKNVTVTFDVSVEVDESKFTDEYMKIFREVFYDFETIEDHMCHLAQLEVRGLLDDQPEGYGELSLMGIKVKVMNREQEIED
jgi:hypothetical protein